MITLKQLSEEIGEDRFLQIVEALKLDAKDSYEEGDEELAKIYQLHGQGLPTDVKPGSAPAPEQEPQTQTKTRKNSKSSAKSTAIVEQAEQTKQQKQGALATGAQRAATAAIEQADKQGKQLGAQANRRMVTSFLEIRSEGMDQFADSIEDGSEAIANLQDGVFASYGAAGGEDFLQQSGSFKLL
jgi:flagellin-like hook-associated protein FlgL